MYLNSLCTNIFYCHCWWHFESHQCLVGIPYLIQGIIFSSIVLWILEIISFYYRCLWKPLHYFHPPSNREIISTKNCWNHPEKCLVYMLLLLVLFDIVLLKSHTQTVEDSTCAHLTALFPDILPLSYNSLVSIGDKKFLLFSSPLTNTATISNFLPAVKFPYTFA